MPSARARFWKKYAAGWATRSARSLSAIISRDCWSSASSDADWPNDVQQCPVGDQHQHRKHDLHHKVANRQRHPKRYLATEKRHTERERAIFKPECGVENRPA